LITFSQHPFLGVGSGTYIVAIRDASVRDRNLVHNTFLSVLAETGLIGITLYGIILYLVIKMLLRQQSLLRTAFLSALVVFCLVSSTVSFEMRIQTWLFFSLLILSANCLQPQETREAVTAAGDARPLKLQTP
jgi:O-antigen ligase